MAMAETGQDRHSGCPICGGARRPAFSRSTAAVSAPVDADLRPTSSEFGTTLGTVLRCTGCGHGSLATLPAAKNLDTGYEHTDDVDDVDEEEGRAATAHRDLRLVANHLEGELGRLVDIGCWTGSLVAAANDMGWRAEGVEPSASAARTARDRGLDVRRGVLGSEDGLAAESFQVVTCCDVLEHLTVPSAAVRRMADLLEAGGVLMATVPDFGSFLARAFGRRWWSVLPMHVQYFTRSSLDLVLRSSGLEILEMTTHPKVFTRRYYADRLGEFVPGAGPVVARMVERSASAERTVAPDLRDRVAVIARKQR